VLDLEMMSPTSSITSDVNEHFKSFFALRRKGRKVEGRERDGERGGGRWSEGKKECVTQSNMMSHGTYLGAKGGGWVKTPSI
jgi:hypothetical protein